MSGGGRVTFVLKAYTARMFLVFILFCFQICGGQRAPTPVSKSDCSSHLLPIISRLSRRTDSGMHTVEVTDRYQGTETPPFPAVVLVKVFFYEEPADRLVYRSIGCHADPMD